MRLRYRNMILCCMLAMHLAGLVSCSNHEPDLKATDTVVSFRVVTPRQTETRTATPPVPTPDDKDTWGDAYTSADGNDFDNRLLKAGFTVRITDNNCTQELTTLTDLLCFETTTTDGNTQYYFIGIIPSEKVNTLKSHSNAKIHVIANAGENPAISEDLSFTQSGQPNPEFDAIPMWGVQTVDLTSLKPGIRHDAGTIRLLRAMAKVEIETASAETDPNLITGLLSATVHGSNSQGYVLPGAWKNVAQTEAIAFDETMRAFASANSTANTPMQPDNTGKKITFYLPETDNEEGNVTLTLTYQTDTGNRTGTIHFAKYDNEGVKPKQYNHIVRNHLYRFSVRLRKQLEIDYTVCPWLTYRIDIPKFD